MPSKEKTPDTGNSQSRPSLRDIHPRVPSAHSGVSTDGDCHVPLLGTQEQCRDRHPKALHCLALCREMLSEKEALSFVGCTEGIAPFTEVTQDTYQVAVTSIGKSCSQTDKQDRRAGISHFKSLCLRSQFLQTCSESTYKLFLKKIHISV